MLQINRHNSSTGAALTDLLYILKVYIYIYIYTQYQIHFSLSKALYFTTPNFQGIYYSIQRHCFKFSRSISEKMNGNIPESILIIKFTSVNKTRSHYKLHVSTWQKQALIKYYLLSCFMHHGVPVFCFTSCTPKAFNTGWHVPPCSTRSPSDLSSLCYWNCWH